jgi:hypothetical protein
VRCSGTSFSLFGHACFTRLARSLIFFAPASSGSCCTMHAEILCAVALSRCAFSRLSSLWFLTERLLFSACLFRVRIPEALSSSAFAPSVRRLLQYSERDRLAGGNRVFEKRQRRASVIGFSKCSFETLGHIAGERFSNPNSGCGIFWWFRRAASNLLRA